MSVRVSFSPHQRRRHRVHHHPAALGRRERRAQQVALGLVAALAAEEAASGALLGEEAIERALADVRLVGRATARKLARDVVLLDDTYNANPASMRAALATLVEAGMQALEDVWGKRPVRVREGGSIPIVGTFSKVLRVPVALIGFGLSDDNLHSPNEKFNLSHFYNGIRTVARLLDLAAEVEAVRA